MKKLRVLFLLFILLFNITIVLAVDNTPRRVYVTNIFDNRYMSEPEKRLWIELNPAINVELDKIRIYPYNTRGGSIVTDVKISDSCVDKKYNSVVIRYQYNTETGRGNVQQINAMLTGFLGRSVSLPKIPWSIDYKTRLGYVMELDSFLHQMTMDSQYNIYNDINVRGCSNIYEYIYTYMGAVTQRTNYQVWLDEKTVKKILPTVKAPLMQLLYMN